MPNERVRANVLINLKVVNINKKNDIAVVMQAKKIAVSVFLFLFLLKIE
jgi:hypothetical protein